MSTPTLSPSLYPARTYSARTPLLNSVISGDQESVRLYVSRGADVNVADEDGLTVAACLVLGAKGLDDFSQVASSQTMRGRLSILSYLLLRNKLTLYSLNAPHIALRGLTLLGMAAYLDQLELVKLMLEEGQGRILVDGVDAHQATPLMYAARDGNVDVVQCLIDHGAGPLLTNANHHSAIQFSLPHPRSLWILEKSLRLSRAQSLLIPRKRRKYNLSLHLEPAAYFRLASIYPRPPFLSLSSSSITKSVQPLISAVLTSDVTTIHKLLFPASRSLISHQSSSSSTILSPAALVNLPDAQGWSAIHYCVSMPRPSKRVLDTLFLAGADIDLYTADRCASPLHCLARAPRDPGQQNSSFQLYTFIVHLIENLGSSMHAKDANGDTCLHVAAEDGLSLEVLTAFLDCDTTGAVRKIQNTRGLTAFDVAKPEFRKAFASKVNPMRPVSVVSVRSIQRRASSASLTSLQSSSSTSCMDSFVSARGTALRRESMAHLAQLRHTTATERLCKGFMDISSALRRFALAEDHSCTKENETSPLGCSDSNSSSTGSPSRDVPTVDSVKASLYDASCASSEIFLAYRKLLDDARDELRHCQGAYDAADALGEQIEDILRERDIASFPCVPDDGPRRPSMSSLGASSVSSAATTLVGSSVSTPVSPTGSPKKVHDEFGSLVTLTEAHEWKPHEMNSSIAARQRDSAWTSWFSIAKRRPGMEQNIMSPLINIVEFERMGLVSRGADAKSCSEGHTPVTRGSKKGGLLRMGTRRRKDSKMRQTEAQVAMEALDAWADLAENKHFMELMATAKRDTDLVDVDPFRCEDNHPQTERIDEVKSRGRGVDANVKAFPSHSEMTMTAVAPLTVKKRSKNHLRTFDLLDTARRELANLDVQFANVDENITQIQRMLAQAEGHSNNILTAKHNLLTILISPCSSFYSDSTVTVHSPRTPLASGMPLPRQPSPSGSSLRLPLQQISRTPSPTPSSITSLSSSSCLPLLGLHEVDDDIHSLRQALQDMPVVLTNVVFALERISVYVVILRDVLRAVRKQHRL